MQISCPAPRDPAGAAGRSARCAAVAGAPAHHCPSCARRLQAIVRDGMVGLGAGAAIAAVAAVAIAVLRK